MTARKKKISRQERRHGRASNQSEIGGGLRARPCGGVGTARRDRGGLGIAAGQRVEVSLWNERCALRGILELQRAPDYPWDGRQVLQLAVAGFVFSSREMERWTVL